MQGVTTSLPSPLDIRSNKIMAKHIADIVVSCYDIGDRSLLKFTKSSVPVPVRVLLEVGIDPLHSLVCWRVDLCIVFRIFFSSYLKCPVCGSPFFLCCSDHIRRLNVTFGKIHPWMSSSCCKLKLLSMKKVVINQSMRLRTSVLTSIVVALSFFSSKN